SVGLIASVPRVRGLSKIPETPSRPPLNDLASLPAIGNVCRSPPVAPTTMRVPLPRAAFSVGNVRRGPMDSVVLASPRSTGMNAYVAQSHVGPTTGSCVVVVVSLFVSSRKKFAQRFRLRLLVLFSKR